jgi:predicted nucleic acid-binding protein
MSWLLDADVLSQPAKQYRDARVVAWLRQEREHCYTTSIVIAQLAYWVRTKQGKPFRNGLRD